jgi:hypothetical protein
VGGTQPEGARGKDAAKDTLGTRDKVREDWRRLHNEELHDIYFSSDILLIFSRRMRWAGHVACIHTQIYPACKISYMFRLYIRKDYE